VGSCDRRSSWTSHESSSTGFGRSPRADASKKKRHEIAHGDLTIEVDVFEGTLAPLCIAEVEFPSVQASERFAPPAWFGTEVTSREVYSNASLALHGLPAVG
jgi:adenylate cyclase